MFNFLFTSYVIVEEKKKKNRNSIENQNFRPPLKFQPEANPSTHIYTKQVTNFFSIRKQKNFRIFYHQKIMPPKVSSPKKSNSKKNKSAEQNDPFSGLSLTGTSLSAQQLKIESQMSAAAVAQEQQEGITDLIGKSDTEKQQQQNDNDEEDLGGVDKKGETAGEEVLCSNNVGTAEDREFDEVIGAIETFLMSDELEATRQKFFSKLPPPTKGEDGITPTLPQQEIYIFFKQYVETIDEALDSYISAKFPKKNMEELALMIDKRKNEVSPDVLELVSGGTDSGLDYESFVQLWQVYHEVDSIDEEDEQIQA